MSKRFRGWTADAVNSKKRKTKAASTNKKVRNATKVKEGGITFPSKLEHAMYIELKRLGIPFEYQSPKTVLQPGFSFKGKKFHPITHTPDFYLPEHGYVIETKGRWTQGAVLRVKMFLHQLAQKNSNLIYLVVRKKKDTFTVAKLIKEGEREALREYYFKKAKFS